MGNLKKVSYYSKTTGTMRKCNIITPAHYSKDKTYPVLYLLHGIGGNEDEWLYGGSCTVPTYYHNTLVKNGVKHFWYTMDGDHNFGVWNNGLYHFCKYLFK